MVEETGKQRATLPVIPNLPILAIARVTGKRLGVVWRSDRITCFPLLGREIGGDQAKGERPGRSCPPPPARRGILGRTFLEMEARPRVSITTHDLGIGEDELRHPSSRRSTMSERRLPENSCFRFGASSPPEQEGGDYQEPRGEPGDVHQVRAPTINRHARRFGPFDLYFRQV